MRATVTRSSVRSVGLSNIWSGASPAGVAYPRGSPRPWPRASTPCSGRCQNWNCPHRPGQRARGGALQFPDGGQVDAPRSPALFHWVRPRQAGWPNGVWITRPLHCKACGVQHPLDLGPPLAGATGQDPLVEMERTVDQGGFWLAPGDEPSNLGEGQQSVPLPLRDGYP